MKKRLLTLLLAVIMCVSLMAIPGMADSIKGGATTTTALNLRSDASTSGKILTTMPGGAPLVVVSQSNGWCKVIYNGTEGYASADYLRMSSSLSANFGTGTITGSNVRMRSAAGTYGSILGTYNAGTQMSVTGVDGNWYAVSYNGKNGYVCADYMKLGSASSSSSSSQSSSSSSQSSSSSSQSSTPAPDKTLSGTGKIIGTNVNMRSGPGTNYSVIGNYSNGVTLNVTGETNGWYAVSYNGKNGYVSSKYFRVDPASGYSSNKTGTITGSDVRFRSGPGTNYSIIGTYGKNTKIEISGESGNWYEGAINGKYGYICKDYVSLSGGTSTQSGTSGQTSSGSTTTSTPSLTPVSSDIGIVTGDGVRMRSGAGTNYSTLGYYNRGTQMTVKGQCGDWYSVSYKGTNGYVSTSYMKLSSGSAQGEQIVATAKTYLGTPYVYGDSKPGGFDCSGFMYYLYTSYGYNIYRTASTQFKNDGVPVDKANLKPGDLVFFSSSTDPISHVGMYIGNGEFIHASSGAGAVVISRLDSSYYTRYYAGARRIIGA